MIGNPDELRPVRRRQSDGLECNWIPTADKIPVIWLRLYGPDEPFWKTNFKMPDIELVK